MLSMKGTNVISGTATCIVLATGKDTYAGQIATSMSHSRQLNAFDFAVRRVVYLFIWFLVFMVRSSKNVSIIFVFSLASLCDVGA